MPLAYAFDTRPFIAGGPSHPRTAKGRFRHKSAVRTVAAVTRRME